MSTSEKSNAVAIEARGLNFSNISHLDFVVSGDGLTAFFDNNDQLIRKLFSVLSGENAKWSGDLFFRGVSGRRGFDFCQVALVPLIPDLDPELTVGENLYFHRKFLKLPKSDSAVLKVLHQLRINELIGETVRSLDLASQRKVMFCRALLQEPKIIICEHPQSKFEWQFLQDTTKHTKIPIVVSSSDTIGIENWCKNICFFTRDKKVVFGRLEKLLSDHVGESILTFSIEPGNESYYRSRCRELEVSFTINNERVGIFLKNAGDYQDILQKLPVKYFEIRKANIGDLYSRLIRSEIETASQ